MNTKAFSSAIAVLGFVFLGSQALALPVTIPPLGAAGGYAVLDISSNGNVSIANASNAGSITGNVGVNGGNLSDSGTSIIGNLVTSGSGVVSLSGGATVSGTTSQNSALLTSAATAAQNASTSAAALASSGGGLGLSSIVLNNAGTVALSTGVYNLTSLVLNGTILDLTAGANYVFNISQSLALSSSQILDSTPADVLFNITGTQGAALSGGSVLDGIVLAPQAGFAEAGGSVVGEIISGGNIGIASGARVTSVPDSGSSLLLLSIGIGCLYAGRYHRGLRGSPAS
jgi:hypothetical protein